MIVSIHCVVEFVARIEKNPNTALSYIEKELRENDDLKNRDSFFFVR